MVVDQMLEDVLSFHKLKVLEPSAGSGNLVDCLMKINKTMSVDCVELNKELRQELQNKGYNVIGSDFLAMEPNPIYDLVIAAPTYKNNVDILHIQHMYEFLKPNGKLISLSYPAWITGEASFQIEFRKWLRTKKYSMRMLEDNSFVENYRTQPSLILTITK